MDIYFIGPKELLLSSSITEATIEDCIKYCENKDILAIDTETTGIDWNKEKENATKALEIEAPIAVLMVSKILYAGTRIAGTTSSMILKQDMGKIKFTEIDTGDPDNPKMITYKKL